MTPLARFAARLALAAGRLDIGNVLAELSWTDFDFWLGFYSVEPFGPRQDDYRAGLLTTMFFNANRGKGTKATKLDELFPSLKVTEPLKPQTREQMHATMQFIADTWSK